LQDLVRVEKNRTLRWPRAEWRISWTTRARYEDAVLS